MGQLYQRGRIWWAKYYVNGRPVRESTGVASSGDQGPPQEAKRFLKQQEGRAAAGLPILPRADRVSYDEASEDLKRHYAVTGERGTKEAARRFSHLDAFFTGWRLARIGPADCERYVAHRQAEQARMAASTASSPCPARC